MSDIEVRLRNWGSSKGIIIPKEIVENLVFKENDVFKLTTKGRSIILEPLATPKSKRYKLPANFGLKKVLEETNHEK